MSSDSLLDAFSYFAHSSYLAIFMMSTSPTEKHFGVRDIYSAMLEQFKVWMLLLSQINEPLFHKVAVPDSYLLRSLVAALLCFPIGIIALYHSLKVAIT